MQDKLSASVGAPSMAHIDREFIPLIAEVTTLGPGNDQHPTVRHLFNWLVDPQRTAEEFNYVIGPLQNHVYDIMDEHFPDYLYGLGNRNIYAGKIAAEALAKRVQVLTGEWDTAGWFVSCLNYDSFSDASEQLRSSAIS